MAVINNGRKKDEDQGKVLTGYQQTQQLKAQDLARGQNANNKPAQQQTATGYNGMYMSANTRQNLQNAQGGYQPSDAVTAAQQALASLNNNRPGAYNSQYSQQLDSILQQITNPKDYKYEFNGDELFKQYADLYTQKGRQASMDAMGQAAGLTGGYGNSYAQQVGNQAYQQYLLGLYDKGIELRDRDYQMYRDQLGDQMNAYTYLTDAENRDYNRYRDQMGDWLTERDYLTGRADTLDERGYGRWQNERDYWTGLAQIENADYRNEQERQEAIRRYNQEWERGLYTDDRDFNERVREFDLSRSDEQAAEDRRYAYNYVMSVIGNNQIPTPELLTQAGLSEEDARRMIQALQTVSRSRGNGGDETDPEAEAQAEAVIKEMEDRMFNSLGGGGTSTRPRNINTNMTR